MRALVVFLVVAVAVVAAMPSVDEKSKVDNSLTEGRVPLPLEGLASLPNGGRQGRCCGWRGYGMYGGYGMGMGMGYGGLYGGMGYGGMGYGGMGYGGLYGGMGYGLYGR